MDVTKIVKGIALVANLLTICIDGKNLFSSSSSKSTSTGTAEEDFEPEDLNIED